VTVDESGVSRVAAEAPQHPAWRRLNPNKQRLLRQWAAVSPCASEKHFIVTAVLPAAEPYTRSEVLKIEAVDSRQRRTLAWRALCDRRPWRQGWQ
jgi:tryptophan-rich hypothetical protein